MSTQKGNDKKAPQKYQNRRAFTVTFNETYRLVIDRAPLDRLCPSCKSQIEWKMQYGKYKPQASISRCVKCEGKSVFKSYRTVCDNCSDEAGCCAKCMEILEEAEDDVKVLDAEQTKEMETFMGGLRERSKRTVQRKVKQELVMWSKDKKCFIEIESGNQLEGLQFKQNHIDLDDEELWSDCSDKESQNDDDEDDGFEDDDCEDEDEEDTIQEKKEQNKQSAKGKNSIKKEQVVKQPKQEQKKQPKKQRKAQDSDDEKALEQNEDYIVCRDKLSDRSTDLERWNRTQKNFKYYFNIKQYPEDEDEQQQQEQNENL